MFTGQVDQISNKATWISETYELYDDSDNTTTDLSTGGLGLAIEVTIKSIDGCYTYATATIDSGKVFVPGPGFYWRFEVSDLSNICAGTYQLGVKVTINGAVIDEIIGTVSVIEGN